MEISESRSLMAESLPVCSLRSGQTLSILDALVPLAILKFGAGGSQVYLDNW